MDKKVLLMVVVYEKEEDIGKARMMYEFIIGLMSKLFSFFFFNDPAPTEISPFPYPPLSRSPAARPGQAPRRASRHRGRKPPVPGGGSPGGGGPLAGQGGAGPGDVRIPS